MEVSTPCQTADGLNRTMKKRYSYKLYLAIFLLLLLITISLPSKLQFISLLCGVFCLIIFDIDAFRELGKTKFWGFIVFIIVIIPFLFGEKNLTIFGIGYSKEYLLLGVRILLRGLSIYIGVILLSRNVSIEELSKIFSVLGFKDLSTTLPIAINILPILRKNSLQSLIIFHLRGGFQKYRIKNIERLCITILLNVIRTAEEIYQIIEIRKKQNNTLPSERSTSHGSAG